MAITYPYDILAGFPGWTTEFDLFYRQEQSRTAGGRTYVKELGSPLWQASYVSRSLSPNELDAWRAKLKALEGGLKEFNGYPISRCYPIAYPDASWPGNAVGSVSVNGSMLDKSFCRRGAPVNTDGALFVTRSGTATVFDVDGVLKTVAADNPRFMYDPAEVNYAWPSEDLASSRWNKVRMSATLAHVWNGYQFTRLTPDASLQTSHQVTQTNAMQFSALAIDAPVTVNFVAKSDGAQTSVISVRAYDTVGFIRYASFNLETGNAPAAGTSMQSMGEGYWLITVTFDARATSTHTGIQIYAANPVGGNVTNFDFNGVDGYLVSAAQIGWGSLAKPYKKTTTGPVAKALGLLVEPTRTNYVLASENLTNSRWNSTRFRAAPAGMSDGLNWTRLTPTADLQVSHQITQSNALTYDALSVDTPVTLKLLAKADGATTTRLSIRCFDSIGFSHYVYFDMATGSAFNAGASMSPDVNGAWLLTVTFMLRAGSTSSGYQLYSANPTTNSISNYDFNGTDGYLISACQMELGDKPTSYIPTGTTAVVRGEESVLLYNDGGNEWAIKADPAIAPRHSTGSLNISGYAGYIKGYEAKLTEPVKILSGVSLSYIGENRDSVVLAGLPAGYDARVGDYLRIRENRLHQIVDVDGADIFIRPHLWPGTMVGDEVKLVRPDCPMVIVPGSISTTADLTTGRGTVSFQAIESR